MAPKNGWSAIAWAPHSRRSEMFARELRGTLHFIHYLRFQSPPHAPLKYVLQAFRTLQVLLKESPRMVHVQNPPFVCVLVVHLYCRLTGALFVTEHHSAAFGTMWDWALPIQRFLARRALTNIVTSEHWADLVRSWRAHAVVMHDPFLDLPQGAPYAVGPGFNVAFVSTFATDEPVDAVLSAARLLPDVHFYITGDTRRSTAPSQVGAPLNVTFTGFLDMNGEYLGLIRAVDAVLVLTTRDHTLQLAGCEAIAVAKPLITSDWPYLRELFAAGTVFVPATAEGIRDGVMEVMARCDELVREIGPYRRARQQEWNDRLKELQQMASRWDVTGRERSDVSPASDATAEWMPIGGKRRR